MSGGQRAWPPDNPFATSAVRPGAIPFIFSTGENAATLVERLRAAQWRGEIVGPHGAGKSTLLATLVPELEAAGRRVLHGQMRPGERRLPKELIAGQPWDAQTQLIIDGFEQLDRCRRAWLLRQCRRLNCGVLVTSHAPTGLPTLTRLVPQWEIVEQVVRHLTAAAPDAVTDSEVRAAFEHHRLDVREMLFELYDRYEARRRASG